MDWIKRHIPHPAYWAPAVFALILLGFAGFPKAISPTLGGDAGFRLHNADILLVPSGFRYWLPGLQAHIHLLYKLEAPIGFYFAVPFTYYALGLLCLNLVAVRLLGPKLPGLSALTAGFLLFSFFPSVLMLGFDLYQEMLCFGLFQLAVYLYWFHPSGRWLVVVVAAAGALTREYFWFYTVSFLITRLLLAVLIRSPVPGRKELVSIAGLLLIPVIWLRSMHIDMVRKFSDTIPLATHDALVRRISDYITNISAQNLWLFLVFSAAAAFLCCRRTAGNTARRRENVEYVLFSILSLGMLYAYAIRTDAWGKTPLNPRIIFPLLIHIPLILILFARTIRNWPAGARVITTFFFLFSLWSASEVHLPPVPSLTPSRYHREMAALNEGYRRHTGGKEAAAAPRYCITGYNRWTDYANYIVAPILYQSRELVRDTLHPERCDIILSKDTLDLRDFESKPSIPTPAGKQIRVYFRRMP